MPFQDKSFDVVICQNVLECVTAKTALIGACCRILKQDGIFLLGHHDYGGVMLNSANPKLTRRIIAAYADETQDWMASSDGEIGRKLPGLVRCAAFGDAVTETRHLVDLSFGEGSYAQNYCREAARAAVQADLPQQQVEVWLQALAELDQRGEFYFGIPWIYVRARKQR